MKKLLSLTLLCFAAATNAAPQVIDADPLQMTVRTAIPEQLTTIEAVQWIVEPFGYRVLKNSTFNTPLSSEARVHRTMPLLHAIQLIIGRDNSIVVDKANKLIVIRKGS